MSPRALLTCSTSGTSLPASASTVCCCRSSKDCEFRSMPTSGHSSWQASMSAAHLLVPQREGDVAQGGDVGLDLVGPWPGARAVTVVRAGGAGGQHSESAERGRGSEETPSSHDVLLTWAAASSSRPPGCAPLASGTCRCGANHHDVMICMSLHRLVR